MSSSAPLCCPNCASTDVEVDAARGDAVCIQCGTVLEENAIVNEVTFAQDAGGGSSVVGQFVAASSGLGFGKESREVAFTNGQRHISQLAQALRLAEHHQEAAQRLFMLAVQHNFIQGRRTQHVIAACLYTVCRREKTPHLLIDFSDVLQTNVYMLGSCFLKFTRLLSLALPIIDPSLYIHRFASKLEFGDKTHLVSMCALRLVQRMKRDWIQTGRRPSGICGAALLIAARVHGFRRTQREVVRVVRICDVTLRRRLTEFADTPMGALTARELDTIDIEALPASDPPSFTRNRRIEDSHRAAAAALQGPDAPAALPAPATGPDGTPDGTLLALNGPAEPPADGAEAGTASTALTMTDGAAAEHEEEQTMQSEMLQGLRDPAVADFERAASGSGTAPARSIPATAAVTDPAAAAAVAASNADADAADAAAMPPPPPRPYSSVPGAHGEGALDPYWTSSQWYNADLLNSRDEQTETESEEAQAVLMAELNDDLEGLDGEVSTARGGKGEGSERGSSCLHLLPTPRLPPLPTSTIPTHPTPRLRSTPTLSTTPRRSKSRRACGSR